MNKKTQEKAFFSTTEVAKVLNLSSVAVFKKIKNGQLKAQKIGRNYVIAKEDLEALIGSALSSEQKDEIESVVKKAVKQYKVTFRRLGKEE
jgi:excisionase family DNA binding protein